MIQLGSPLNHWSDTKRIHVSVPDLILSGSYITGGDTFNISNPLIKTGATQPLVCLFAPSTPYIYTYIPGSNLTNGKIKIFSLANGLELPAGPYPSILLNDSADDCYMIFKKYVDLG
jgi:hypothetical protein